MTKRNPDPNPEIFELSTSPESDSYPDTIHLSPDPVAGHGSPQASVSALRTRGAYHIWTIGCQMNVADSNHVAAELERIGYRPTEAMDEADIVVLNTCVVSAKAPKTRESVRPATLNLGNVRGPIELWL